MNSMLTQCPLCSGPLTVTRLQCDHCDITIEGQFAAQPADVGQFSRLSNEQMQFLLAFLRCDGRFNRLEEELNLSYPTLRNRFNDILRTMGFEPTREEPPNRPGPEERRRILEELDQGLITHSEAQRRLRGRKEEIG